jgi:hypothetical protein
LIIFPRPSPPSNSKTLSLLAIDAMNKKIDLDSIEIKHLKKENESLRREIDVLSNCVGKNNK